MTTLDEAECWARLTAAAHGVLGTIHPARGIDAVPVVYAVVDHDIVVPIDTVKAKSSMRLQRTVNVERDPRCVLLVDAYDPDWSKLWWVRVHASARTREPRADDLAALAARYADYAPTGAIDSVLVLTPTSITGWSAT